MDFSWRCEWSSDWSDDKAKCPPLSITNTPWCVRGVAMGYIIVPNDTDQMPCESILVTQGTFKEGAVPSTLFLKEIVYLLPSYIRKLLNCLDIHIQKCSLSVSCYIGRAVTVLGPALTCGPHLRISALSKKQCLAFL